MLGLEITSPFMQNLNDLGAAGFAMMIPLLSGYIANSLAGKPGLVPGMILGFVANNPIGAGQVKTGFLGAMIMGVAAGYFVRWCKTWKVPSTIQNNHADLDCTGSDDLCTGYVLYLRYLCADRRSDGLVS